MPLVSVVIPVFNGAPFVEKAVASVRGQTITDSEILVVDDGSTDGTQAVLETLARTMNIRWFQQDHGGPARSRNRGLAEATGDYVALLDCDDVWLPRKLEQQLAVMDARPRVGLVHSDFEVVDEAGVVLERVRARQSPQPLVQAFAGGHTALPSTLLIRRALVEKVGALDPELYGSEDSDLTIRLHDVAEFECIDEVLVRKLQRGHGYRDMAYDEREHRAKVLTSRERFLRRLEQRPHVTAEQRSALNREWGSYYLMKGYAEERFGAYSEARRSYGRAIRVEPTRLRGYLRWLRTLGR